MYLFVSIFLLLSAMGLFTELYMIQAVQLMKNQKTVAEVMHVWHQSAYKMAKEIGIDNASPGCGLTYNLVIGNGQCKKGSLALYLTTSVCPACGSVSYLPVGTLISFPSIAYAAGTAQYIATYVEGTSGATALGYSAAEILAQMRKTSISKVSYGQFINGPCNPGDASAYQLATNYYIAVGKRVCYPGPTGTYIPVGSVAYITVL